MNYILGIKKGMTRVFEGDNSIPVTILDTEGCVVCYVTEDGIELGIGKKKGNKALEGKYSELGYVPMHRLWISGKYDLKVGDKVNPAMFSAKDKVLVKGVTKGKGFAGVVRRWGFAGGPRTHGQSDRLRAPGSIGAGTEPGRVLKGKKMAGRLGSENMTVKGKKVVNVKESFVLVSGAVPGGNGDLVLVAKV